MIWLDLILARIPLLREFAVGRLCDSKDPRATDALIQVLRSQYRYRDSAARALGITPDRRAVAPLIEALEDDDVHVKIQAARALGKIGDTRAIEPVAKLFRNALTVPWDNALSQVWLPAQEALVGFGKAATHSLRALLLDRDDEVRWKAAEVLGEIGDPEAADAIAKALTDGCEVVRVKAASALGKLRLRSSVAPLVAALQDESNWVRSMAARSLGEVGGEEILAPLQEAAAKDPIDDSRRAAQMAAAKIKDRLHPNHNS